MGEEQTLGVFQDKLLKWVPGSQRGDATKHG
jgi:hypothetical protein